MIHDEFSIPSGAVPGYVSGLQQHVCCKVGKRVVGDGEVCTVQFLLSVLHVDDELIDTRVAVPLFVQAKDEFHAREAVKASTEFSNMIEEILWRDGGEENVRVMQLLNPRCFDVGDDQVARANFHCTDPVLVVCSCLPYMFHAAHH